MPEEFIYKYLSDDDLKAISEKIAEIEKKTSAELVITIKEKRNWQEKFKSVRQLAEKEFISAKIGKTKGATGILIFMIFNAKEFCILADDKINQKVKQSFWDEIADDMTKHFKKEEFCNGIIKGIEQTGTILNQHFPIQPGDVNELSNEVRIK